MGRTLLAGLAAVTILGALVGLHAWSGHRMHDVATPAGLEVPEGGVTLPMHQLGGRPLVEVTIHGKGPYRFLLDTAASCSVIDPALQKELALPAGSVEASTPSGASVPLVTVDELRMGAVRLSGLAAVVMPVAQLFPAEPRPQGVLTALAFPGHLVTFDYPGAKIVLAKGELPAGDPGHTFACDGLPQVPIEIAGQEVRVDLDTGADLGLTLPRRYLATLPLASTPVPSGKTRTPTAEAALVAAKVQGPIKLGAHTLDLDAVRFGDVKPGTVGYAALRGFVVTLDSKNRRVRLVR